MTILYFDLDGTLIDVRKRYYDVYADTARELGLTPASEKVFWEQHLSGTAILDLIGDVNDSEQERFLELWLERTDAPSYVRLDTLLPGAQATLASLRKSYEMIEATQRGQKYPLQDVLDRLSPK
jgi:phosphoglycolate phosphatase-like HAD superfamily hydrolase